MIEKTLPEQPTELLGPTPRLVRFSERSRFMPVILTLLIGVTLFSWLWFGRHAAIQMQRRLALREGGIEVQAEIISLKRAGRGPDIVKYSFTLDEQKVIGQAEVPPEIMSELRSINIIAIRYLPSDPFVNHPSAWEWSLLSEWLLIFMLSGLLMVCISTLVAVHKERKLAVWGIPVCAIVISCEGSRGSFRVHYEFRTETGILIEESSNVRGRQEVGDQIWVLYLEQNPRRSIPYPLLNYDVQE